MARFAWTRAWTVAAALTLGLGGCEASVEEPRGLFEPLVVHEGELQTRELQTAPALESAPAVVTIEIPSRILQRQQQDRAIAGRVSESAYAVAVRLIDHGSNWWIVPVGSVDPDIPDQRAFDFDYDVGATAPLGKSSLAIAAIDANGQLGKPSTLDICVTDDANPANLSVCDPKLKPPELTVNLQWDSNVDLDLLVVTPSGETIAWKSPATFGDNPKEALGRLLRDSNAQCVADHRNAESVVFDKFAPPGTYLIYANLFAACGEPGVVFVTHSQRGVANGDGTYRQVEIQRSSGAFIAQQASNFKTLPLYLGTFVIP